MDEDRDGKNLRNIVNKLKYLCNTTFLVWPNLEVSERMDFILKVLKISITAIW